MFLVKAIFAITVFFSYYVFSTILVNKDEVSFPAHGNMIYG